MNGFTCAAAILCALLFCLLYGCHECEETEREYIKAGFHYENDGWGGKWVK